MACGNNKVSYSTLVSEPRAVGQPAPAPAARNEQRREAASRAIADARGALERAEQTVRAAASPSDVRSAVKQATDALAAARRSGDRTAIRALERQLAELKRSADTKAAELHSSLLASEARATDRLAPQNLGVPTKPSAKAFKDHLSVIELEIGRCVSADDVERVIANAAGGMRLDAAQQQRLDDRLQRAAAQQQEAVAILGAGSLQHIDYSALPAADDAFGEALLDAWTDRYTRDLEGRDVLTFKDANGFVYLYDATTTASDAEPRFLGVLGHVLPPTTARDNSRIGGFPSQSRAAKEAFDRGHMIAHELGGSDDGHNLVGQAANVNRKGLWRAIERDLKARPGTMMFVRAVYQDGSDRPAAFEHGQVRPEGGVDVAYFRNT